MDPEAVLEDCTVDVGAEAYAVVTTDSETAVSDAFATIRDRNETTHVVREERLDAIETLEEKRGWALLTFDAVLPFELVGFLAVVATALAERDVSIFALSAYSTDHVLVQRDDVAEALDALEELGCESRRL
ncbi:hypothetical protein SAMN04487950_1457 [Halogranum rubrum]|uniref:CASTOR ACT domain-containing protein n=1 Tax=Halogranum rubrum TaxID=553466 RepID=A0A1I4CY85_9EURY|nr:ACT domain-containing protein [Halogranum rubrum]SFK85600.1 hypothetical protein SAMN04487950_1457 [Halogranum rubrum]